jgi:hypothetical protein
MNNIDVHVRIGVFYNVHYEARTNSLISTRREFSDEKHFWIQRTSIDTGVSVNLTQLEKGTNE